MNSKQSRSKQWQRYAPLPVTLAAIIMGLPTLKGGFVGGDDHRLALDHVLVNHPSLEHALELFRIVHRDLYQPLPLLSFQFEFVLCKALGLLERGPEGFGWLFHLTNILLHAANALLVFLVVRRLHVDVLAFKGIEANEPRTTAVALVAGLLFAAHPLQVEVVAWLNGRMMLLSTLFGLLAIYTLRSWLHSRRWWQAALTPLLVILSGISKVRSGLPVLLLIPVLLSRGRRCAATWTLWILCFALTAALVGVNVYATASADLFAEGAEHLKGPRLARVLLALAWYVRHFFWPTGLTSYHPTPFEVSLLGKDTLLAMSVLAITAALGMLLIRRLYSAVWGFLWFAFGIGDTLPFFPARNVLAADRYMYLPIIGAVWILGEALIRWWPRTSLGEFKAKPVLAALSAVVLTACLGMSWHVGVTYNDSLAKTYRVAQVYPDEPRVWEYYGWSCYARARYEEAIESARKELRHNNPNVQCGAYQLMGMAEIKRGNVAIGLELLKKALEIEPDNTLALFRMGMALDDLGRYEEAVFYYERAVETAPRSNPTMQRLARLYMKLNRPEAARAMFEKQLENNRHEVPAILGLAELDIASGTTEGYQAAWRRLEALLQWMPENAAARVNLGIALNALGDTAGAIRQYQTALEYEPSNVTAMLNLAELYFQLGRIEDAVHLAQRASGNPALTPQQIATVEEVLVGLKPYLHLKHNEFAGAIQAVESDALLENSPTGKGRRQRLLAALEHYDAQHPDSPWPVCLGAALLIADDARDAAGVFLNLCEARCGESEDCKAYAVTLRERLQKTP